MRADWDNWFLDCRYEKSATSLHRTLKKHFPKHASLTDLEGYVRLIYNSEIRDEFGIHHVPVLVHAYWGFDPVPPAAVERMVADEYKSAYQKTIIGSRFEAETLEAGSEAAIRCVPLEEIYFVNDPYAEVCRKFVAG